MDEALLNSLKSMRILKRSEMISDQTLAFFVADLKKNFTDEQIKFAINYFTRRSKWFPDLSDFYELLAPVKTPETLALEVVTSYVEKSFKRVNFADYSEVEAKLFDIISPNIIREATAISLSQYKKTLQSFLISHFSQTEQKLLQHRESINNSKLKIPELKNLLTTPL